jgi:glycyl-tRNA synthetase beta subunit
MTERISFTKYEHDSIPLFREKITKAESIEDVKKVFAQTMRMLIMDILQEQLKVRDDDVVLQPNSDTPYEVSDRLLSLQNFKALWERSDLPQVISRFAQSASGRYRHLEKKPEKTESRIRI